MEISIITGEAMRESLLSPKLYQALKYILAVTLIIILILPLPAINQKKINYWLVGSYCLVLGDWLATWMQHHHIHWVISIIMGYVIAFIICIILYFYTAMI